MSEQATIPRPTWATRQDWLDEDTVESTAMLPAHSTAGPSPVVIFELWETVTTRDGTLAIPETGPLLHVGQETYTAEQARVLRDRLTEALALLT